MCVLCKMHALISMQRHYAGQVFTVGNWKLIEERLVHAIREELGSNHLSAHCRVHPFRSIIVDSTTDSSVNAPLATAVGGHNANQ